MSSHLITLCLAIVAVTFLGMSEAQTLPAAPAQTPAPGGAAVIIVPVLVNSTVAMNITPVVTVVVPPVVRVVNRCSISDQYLGTGCVMSNCGVFRKLVCSQTTTRDLQSVLEQYGRMFVVQPNASVTVNRTSTVPLYLQLNGGTVNLTSNLFSSVADQVGKLELNQVNLGTLPEDAFSGLTTLTVLKLDGVMVDSLPNGAFRGLGDTLQTLTLKNLTTLSSIQAGAFEPVLMNGTSALRCLDMNIATSPALTCDCKTHAWIQTSLGKVNKPNVTAAWPDFFAEKDNGARVPCDVSVICSANSTMEAFRQVDIMDVNLNAVCAPPTTTTTTTMATTAAKTDAPKVVVVVATTAGSMVAGKGNGAQTMSAYIGVCLLALSALAFV